MGRVRRRTMKSVDVWTDEPGPVGLFGWQCSPIYNLYTRGLQAAPTAIAATASWTRLSLTADSNPIPAEYAPAYRYLGADLAVLVDEPADNFGFSDGGWVRIDAELLTLPAEERAAGYLNWLHHVMVRLARFRGWDEEPLRHAYQYCLDHDLTARFDSPRRRSPDRRHTATLTLHIDPDGIRHLIITVLDRTGTVVSSEEGLLRPFFADHHEWGTLSSRFRWTSDTSLATESGVVAFSMSLPGAPRPVTHATLRMPVRGFKDDSDPSPPTS